MHPSNRRTFLSSLVQLLGLTAVGSFFPILAQAERKRGGGDSAAPAAGGAKELAFPLVEPGKGAAAAVSYVEDHKKVKKELQTERQGVKFDAQNCANCGFYKKVGDKSGKEVGTCQIFPGSLVKSNAWCSSWNKRA